MRSIFLGLTLIALAFAGCSADRSSAESDLVKASPSPSQDRESQRYIDFSVKGIRLGDTEQNLVKIFGKPQKRIMSNDDVCGVAPIVKLRYPGIEFWLDRGTGGTEFEWAILEFTITSPELLVEPGIRVGDDLGTVNQKLGAAWTEKTDDDSVSYHYLTKDNDNATLEYKNGKLDRIRLYINPC
jgi:hypothetical protein